MNFRDWCIKVDTLLDPHGYDADMLSTMDEMLDAYEGGMTPEEVADQLSYRITYVP